MKASDSFGNLTTLTYDVSGANLLRRDVGGTSPATERYTQPSKDFGGLLAQVSTANPSPRYYIADLARNIGVLANGSTISELYLSQAFGLALPGSSTPTTQPYGFQGYAGAYTDPVTGLVVMWNRAYDPNIGQFLNPDPIGFAGGDANYRRFVQNNAVRWVDPTGRGANDTYRPYLFNAWSPSAVSAKRSGKPDGPACILAKNTPNAVNCQGCCDEFYWSEIGNHLSDAVKDALKDCLKECKIEILTDDDPFTCVKECLEEKCGNLNAIKPVEDAERFFDCCYGCCDDNFDSDPNEACDKNPYDFRCGGD